jgi:hypothetical protein
VALMARRHSLRVSDLRSLHFVARLYRCGWQWNPFF